MSDINAADENLMHEHQQPFTDDPDARPNATRNDPGDPAKESEDPESTDMNDERPGNGGADAS